MRVQLYNKPNPTLNPLSREIPLLSRLCLQSSTTLCSRGAPIIEYYSALGTNTPSYPPVTLQQVSPKPRVRFYLLPFDPHLSSSIRETTMDNGQNNPPNQAPPAAANATANPNLQNQPTIPINGGSGDDGTNGGSNDSADEQHAPDREPEENRVVTWNGVGGTFGGWDLDDDFPCV